MKEKSESEVAQLCPTLSDPMDCSLPGIIDMHKELKKTMSKKIKQSMRMSFSSELINKKL